MRASPVRCYSLSSWVPFLFCSVILFIFACNTEKAQALSEDVYIQVQSARIRESPKHWAKSVVEVRFGDKVTLLEQLEDWRKVQSPNQSIGFLHQSAITSKRVVLRADVDVLLKTTVDEPDVYLAGKGFSDEIEKSFAAANPSYDFKALDSIISEEQKMEGALLSFIVDGKLRE